METFWQDLRYGFRVLIKNPGFTIVAVLTLAIGIGANTAIFSVVNAVLLRPLPFRDPASLCLLLEHMPGNVILGPSYLNFGDWRAQSKAFEGIAGVHNQILTMTGAAQPERIQGQMATANVFSLLGVTAVAGRTFLPQDDQRGAPGVALLSYAFWQSHFAASNDALGKSLTLDNQPYTIVGVLPPQYQLTTPTDVMIPFEPWASTTRNDRSWHIGIVAVGRLKKGVSIESARAEMATIASRLEKEYPINNVGVGASVNELQDQLVQNIRPALIVLLGAVGLVLLIACGNIANLLLARASSRTREIALRTAVGAARGRIVRQLLTESTLLAFAGGLVGVGLAFAAIPPLVRLAGSSIPNLGPIEADYRVLLFVSFIVLVAGVLFGLGPALQTTKLDLRAALNEASRGSTGGSAQRNVRSIVVVTEIALAMMLLIGAGLLLRSFERLQKVEPGFRPNNLLVADVPLSPKAYQQPATRRAFFDRLIERTSALPGVVSVGAATFLPVSGGGPQLYFNIQGRPPKSHTPRDYLLLGYRPVSAHYLETLKVPLLRGRFLQDSDTERGPHVALVNQTMAAQQFPGENPLGKRIQMGALPNDELPYLEIVGVVGDMKQNLATDMQAEVYIPYREADGLLPVFGMSIVLRTTQYPHQQASALRNVVHDIDPNQPLARIRTMEENMSGNVSEPRFRTALLSIFAGSALLLSIVGLYGVMMYSVTRRIPEIGIRITLGAQRIQILNLVLAQGLKLALIGVAAGIAGALILSRILAKFLYQVATTDPLTYAAVAAVLISVALLASYIPARRAIQIDPMAALRHE